MKSILLAQTELPFAIGCTSPVTRPPLALTQLALPSVEGSVQIPMAQETEDRIDERVLV